MRCLSYELVSECRKVVASCTSNHGVLQSTAHLHELRRILDELDAKEQESPVGVLTAVNLVLAKNTPCSRVKLLGASTLSVRAPRLPFLVHQEVMNVAKDYGIISISWGTLEDGD